MDCQSVNRRLEWVSLKPGVPVQVMKFGEPSPNAISTHSSKDSNLMFLVIPGNPGVIEYYEKFMETLYLANGKKIPVWGISHTGHVSTKHMDGTVKISTGSSAGIFSLQDQIEHKLAFIQHFIPSQTSLILIGHSIGCYMILKMLKHLNHEYLLHSFLLFPTIERMAISPKGQVMTPLLKFFRWITLMFVYFLSFLSHEAKYRILLWYFKGKDVYPKCIYNASMNIFDLKCIDNITYMASEEMKTVTDLDRQALHEHIWKLSFYYGQKDSWCPLDYCHDLKRQFPHADIRICQKQMEHAFVMTSSELMASVLTKWLKKKAN